jgi:integrase
VSKIAFTDQGIKKLPIGKHFDTSTPAFGIRVGKNRSTFIVQRGADRRIIRVGHYPAMSLSEARTKGKQLLASTQLNHERVTFEDAYTLYKKTHLPRLKARTQSDYQRFLDRYYMPVLAKRRLDAITSHMTDGIADALVETPTEQSHCIAYGKTFFKWCVRRRYITFSPLDGAQLPKAKRRKRVLTDEELVAVWNAAGRYGGHFGSIVRLLILRGLRRGECAAIENDWVQLDTVTLPDRITKNGREHVIPLGTMACAILSKKSNHSVYLFPEREGQHPFSGFSQSKKNLDKLLNIAPWRLHDLRRTYRTNLGRLRVAPHIGERLVNHVAVQNDVEATYDVWQYLDEMTEAVEKYENWFKKLLD